MWTITSASVPLVDKLYNTYVEDQFPDNWWHSKEYYNVSLTDFMAAFKQAVRAGYTVELWGDVSVAGD